jgi:hypothetical protein
MTLTQPTPDIICYTGTEHCLGTECTWWQGAAAPLSPPFLWREATTAPLLPPLPWQEATIAPLLSYSGRQQLLPSPLLWREAMVENFNSLHPTSTENSCPFAVPNM